MELHQLEIQNYRTDQHTVRPDTQGIRVLLVEDDDGDARLLELALRGSALGLHRVSSLGEALSYLAVSQVDVVLLDLSLPDAEGFETISRVRNAASELPVVVLTGLDDERFALHAIRAGAQDYHVKGQVGSTTLPRILLHAMERQRTQVALERRRNQLAARVREKDTELRESEERFKLLVESVEDYAIIMLDPAGNVVSWNIGAQRTMGYGEADIVGKHLSSFFVPSDVAKGEPEKALAFARETGRFEQEGWRVRKDGSRFYGHTLMAAIRDRQRNLKGFANITRDITEIIEAQQRALQAERLAAIGQMVTGLAHESRNALQRIQSTVNRIGRKARDQADLLRLVADIEEAGDDLKRLYEEVREYAAPINLDRRSCDVREVWREVWSRLCSQYVGTECVLEEEECEEVDPRSNIDRFRLMRVFRNILENAVDASEDAVKITIACKERMIRGVPALEIRFRDFGSGLSPEQREKIFNPFFTTKTSGTGLGMAIVKRIVEAHGGTVEVGAPLERGTEIVLTLPRE